jgi:hypothetical protein
VTALLRLPLADDVEHAIERLKSLHEGDLGVVEITACGSRAIPALRALLLESEASGIYQPRCRAVEALAALGAHDVLIAFLRSPRDVPDPVNRTGEEAVVNAAARALIGVEDERIFPLLLELAQTRMLAGVVEALGSFGRAEALPPLIRGLSEDHTRPAAEAALLRLGVRARAALIEVATQLLPLAEWESPSSLRTRLSAVRLLDRIGVPGEVVRGLLDDADPEIAAAACHALLTTAAAQEKRHALRRLIGLLPRLSWVACEQAEECLAENFESARDIIFERLRKDPPPADGSPEARIYRSLLRVARRAPA